MDVILRKKYPLYQERWNLVGKFELNKIAARWPAKAVAQFYFIDIKKQWKHSS